MLVRLFLCLVCLSVVGLAQNQERDAAPRDATAKKLGDLVIEVVAVKTPAELTLGQGKFAPPSDHYWVVAEVNFRNAGTRAVCASFSGSLKGEYGLVARTTEGVPPISELLPHEQERRNVIFTLKRGADPLELTVSILSYGGGDCSGDSLPRSSATSMQFPVTGVSSPKDDESQTPKPTPPLPAPKRSDTGDRDTGVYRIGGGVSPPSVIFKVEPEYSKEARKAKFQGTVVLFVVVDEKGNPRDVKVIRPLGLGLDQKAVEAVEKWRFKPGMKDGRAVPAQATIEVHFSLPTKRK